MSPQNSTIIRTKRNALYTVSHSWSFLCSWKSNPNASTIQNQVSMPAIKTVYRLPQPPFIQSKLDSVCVYVCLDAGTDPDTSMVDVAF